MIESQTEEIKWYSCEKPWGYWDSDGDESQNQFWRKGDPYYYLPGEDGEYLVTMRNGDVRILEYDCEYGFDGAAPHDDIAAWAELPEGLYWRETK